jgi:hypothetical protein
MPRIHRPFRRVAALATAHAAALATTIGARLLMPVSAGAQTAAPAKTVTQICLAPAAIEAAPTGVDPVTAVRETFVSFLTGPTLTAEPLAARLPSQAREEAKLNGCALLLFPTIKHERKSGGGGLFGKVASGAVQQGAYSVSGATSSTVGHVVAGAAAGAAQSAAYDYASNSRVKDELTLSYRLESASGEKLLEESDKRKATADGEDLLTPLVQHAAEDIAAAAAKGGR